MQPLIDVIAPASAAPLKKLNAALDWLKEREFACHLPKDLLKPKLFFASPLENQLQHVQAALRSPAPFLWCLRGGYGSARLIPFLSKMREPKREKTLIGFSDITALHLFLTQKWNWKTIHGRVLAQLDPEGKSSDDLLYETLLRGELKEVRFSGLKPMNAAAKKVTTLKGVVTGGNLRIVETSLGTSWQLEAEGKILFLEDVGERGYAIHRMLLHLEQACVLNKKVKAVVLGSFTEGTESDGKDRTQEALSAYAQNSPVPFFSGMPCGHGERNAPLPFNTPAFLTMKRSATLTVKL
jgi:muramoyltetrapeptide carboxypeptidase